MLLNLIPSDWSVSNYVLVAGLNYASSGIFCPENSADVSVPVNRGLL